MGLLQKEIEKLVSEVGIKLLKTEVRIKGTFGSGFQNSINTMNPLKKNIPSLMIAQTMRSPLLKIIFRQNIKFLDVGCGEVLVQLKRKDSRCYLRPTWINTLVRKNMV